jgi:hypothetical protein
MNAPSWLGITPPLRCIYSDTPRKPGDTVLDRLIEVCGEVVDRVVAAGEVGGDCGTEPLSVTAGDVV